MSRTDERPHASREMDHLAEAIRDGPRAPVRTACFLSPPGVRDSVWSNPQFADPSKEPVRVDVSGLLNLQQNLLVHYFRLQKVERKLSLRARSRRHGSGRLAVLHTERERQRIGRELHTGVGQMLAAIRLQIELITAHMADPPEPVRQALGRIHLLADEAMDQVRSVSHRLHPPEWQRLTLDSALRQVWEISGVPEKYRASLRIQEMPAEPDLEAKVLIYRAVQEALSNLTRHSRAATVDLTLERSDRRLVLTVKDDGVGFDAGRLFAAPASVASGLGLRTIREQAAALGGKLVLESGPKGTKLEVSVPFTAALP